MLRCDVSIAKKATPTTVTDDEPNLKVANICISFLSQLLFSENPFLLCPIYYPIGWSVQQSSPCTETRQKLYIDTMLDFFTYGVLLLLLRFRILCRRECHSAIMSCFSASRSVIYSTQVPTGKYKSICNMCDQHGCPWKKKMFRRACSMQLKHIHFM